MPSIILVDKTKEGMPIDISSFYVGTIGLEPMTSAMWLQRSKPAGLRPYFIFRVQSYNIYSSSQIFIVFFSEFFESM